MPTQNKPGQLSGSNRKDIKQLFRRGMLHLTDHIPTGDPALGPALFEYSQEQATNRQAVQWRRAVSWMENIFFSLGRQYVDDVLINRITQSSSGSSSLIGEQVRQIPRPVNDLLGRYIETNIALLTENQPRPRVTPKSDRAEDIDAAELSEYALEYLWEANHMPGKHRELARILLHCGVGWMENIYDPTVPRRISVPKTEEQPLQITPEGMGAVTVPGATRPVTVRDERGRAVTTDQIEYGDITSRVVSPFEMHVPYGHDWFDDDMGWVMRESFVSIQSLYDKYSDPKLQKELGGKRKGWHFDRLTEVKEVELQSLPLWWWYQLSDLVEGQGQGVYGGNAESWGGYTVVRIFDRKPNPNWPRGRTIIAAGDQIIYDSPKSIGARAYDTRWPNRWHPYTIFHWERQIGSVYGRALVTKLLPKLKRVNAIDTTLIMWRRTVPISTWLVPKGANVVDDIFTGRPGGLWEYDPIRTRGAKPEPVFPMNYPAAAIQEREQQIVEMETIAGTEEILRGQRPQGVNSAMMIDILRKQALASRSAILSQWDEGLQTEGQVLLQEVIKNVKNDTRYAERIRILASESKSRLTIDQFSGMDLSDNTNVRVDTASLALVSKEAREAKAIEFLQYAPGLMALPLGLRQSIIEELGFDNSLNPQGPDVERAKRMIAWIRQGQYERVIPMPEDDPYVFYELLKAESQAESAWDMDQQQIQYLHGMLDIYKEQIQIREQAQVQMQMAMAAQEGGEGKRPGFAPGQPPPPEEGEEGAEGAPS
jgi:hypothetical protein